MKLEEKFYTLLCALFAILVVVSNMIYQKFVYLPILSVHVFEISAGAVFYPASFLITNLITEFYGKEKAQFCVRLSTAINITVCCLVQFIGGLEATKWSKIDNATFNSIFGVYGFALLGSLVASYIAQMVDIRLYLLIKKLISNRYLVLSSLSSAVSLLVDTSIVIIFIAIIGAVPYEQVFPLILNSYMYKLSFIIIATPIFLFIVMYFKRKATVAGDPAVYLY